MEKDGYVFKAFQEENLAIDEWVKYMKTKEYLEYLELGSFMGNIYKVVNGEISKEKYSLKNIFFCRNEQLIVTCKINFTTA